MEKQVSIAIIDDDAALAANLKDILEAEGYSVEEVNDGGAGIALFQEKMFDLALVDIKLPDIPGPELVSRLSRLRPETEYVMITGHATMETAIEAVRQKQIIGYENKPIDMERLLTFIREVMRRRRAEEALRESEEKYRLLIENATDAIFIAQDEVLKFANLKAEKMTGYSVEELTKIPFVDIIHPEDRDMVLERHMKRLKGEEIPSIYSFRILNRSGEELSVDLNAVLINWEGRPATLNFLRDITAQKRLEAQLQEATKMEAIATLAGGIAHEFNNALAIIVGNIELLEMDFADNKTVTGHTEAMKTSYHRMVNLTSQLRAYAREGKYQSKTMSLSDFVEDTLPIIKPNIDPSIRLEMDLPRDVFSVKADPIQMQMVLSAVVSNSTEAIEGNGRIRITVSNKEIDSEFAKNHPELNPGNHVCLTVEDDGKGMDAETLNKIFDPFYTTKFMGRGLGMAAVYGIIRNHDGWITVDSELNKGTIIRIYLPGIEV
jgi:PAS domain S-box-containing protein